ncbi:unnamed protein product [Prunus armeniaca]|uniref:Uncharacterized protein n=1 Tax=Prunus armeniaca TaxID=36596 RepID=A0A6J5XDN7_PRUAR|nr:unnamed protein product [Prunus armeniaca]CAB4308978.1 unnamed protein product [Prunus armeniaca]
MQNWAARRLGKAREDGPCGMRLGGSRSWARPVWKEVRGRGAGWADPENYGRVLLNECIRPGQGAGKYGRARILRSGFLSRQGTGI